jgi:glycoprotein endo-alpha-1,2-mannosidase
MQRIGIIIAAGLVVSASAGCRTPGTIGAPSPRVHAFYYPWYANPETDGRWEHWNHALLLRNGEGKRYAPPADIGANFYPAQGLYSSKNPSDVETHMRQCRQARVGVLILSWWGQGSETDRAVPLIMDLAERHNLSVGFHIEPYPGRSAESVRGDLVYIHDRYGSSSAFYRDPRRENRGVFYVYDSYLVSPENWAKVLTSRGDLSIRGTEYDALVIGLWVNREDGAALLNAGFDGFYTYFATNGFTYGSTIANWRLLSRWAGEHAMIFIPSVGPGYDDTRIRPWNERNRRSRDNGAYYDRMWRAAIDAGTDAISVTSFDEWHEGTQIAPATPKEIPGYKYLDYSPRDPDFYLERTAYWVGRFAGVR